MSNADPYFGNLVLKGFQEAQSLPLPPWGPPTAAWYGLLALLLGLGLWRLKVAVRAYQANAYRRAALTALEQMRSCQRSGEFQPYVQQLMVLLKSTALHLGSRRELAALDAQQCLHYLNRRQECDYFSPESVQLAARAYGRSAAGNSTALAALECDIEMWLRGHTGKGTRRDD